MKFIKFLFWLIILGLLSLFIYQNIDYFLTKAALSIDLKRENWQWTTPELPAIAFWGICFGLGLLFAGFKGLLTSFGLGKEIKKKDAEISTLKAEISDLNTRLNVFTHDPYIKKRLKGETEDNAIDEPAQEDPIALPEPEEDVSQPSESSDQDDSGKGDSADK